MTDNAQQGHLVADDVTDGESYEETRDDGAVSRHDVEVRRNAVLSGVLGGVAALLALAWLVRAVRDGGGVGTWLFILVLAGIGVTQLVAFLDARVPLLVADPFGVRIRLGREWRGLPWSSLEQVVIEQNTSLLHDGRLVVAPRFLDKALEGLDEKARRQVAISQKVYGAPLVVPLGMTTKVSAPHLVDALAELAGGRTAVIELAGHVAEPVLPLEEDHLERIEASQRRMRGFGPGGGPQLAGAAAGGGAVGQAFSSDHERGQRAFVGLSIFDKLGFDEWGLTRERLESLPRPHLPQVDLKSGPVATLISRAAHGRSHDVDAAPAAPTMQRPPAPSAPRTEPSVPSWTPAVPLRSARPASRVDVQLETQPVILTATAAKLDPVETEEASRLPEADILHHHSDWDDRSFDAAYEVRPIAVPGEPVEPVVIDDFEPDAAPVPVLGPEIAAARTRLGLDVDALSDRTRIRPHVIEAIEVDDFEPCGGDFYARGHLRALARVLGMDADELVAGFDERYASAPIRASRVFEAELATGMRGGLRATFGGPRWGFMLAVVLVLILVWGVARLFATDTPQAAAPPSLSASADSGQKQITSIFGAPVRLSVRAERGASDIVVRDHSGRVLWTGQLGQGSHRQIVGVGPFTVRASDPSVVDVWLAGKPQGAIGSTTTPAARTFKP